MSLNCVITFICIQCIFVVVAGSFNESIIETQCDNNVDCKEFEKINKVANTTCFNHRCICKDSDFKTIPCLPQKLGLSNVIGGKCPCSSIKWSTCVDGFCMCRGDFITSEDKRNCLPEKVPFGSSCENDVQCSKENSFATCSNHTCTCQSDFILHNGTCHSLVGNECEADIKCVKPNTICVSQKCFCEPGYVAKLDKTACLPNADYNDSCSESVQCQHKLGLGAVCEQSKCVCGEDFSTVSMIVANDTKTVCEKRIAIGQMCAYDTDCFLSRSNGTEQSMYCHLKQCQCTRYYESDSYQRYCIKSNNAILQSTWLDSLLSTFAPSSSNQNKSFYYLMATVWVLPIILFV